MRGLDDLYVFKTVVDAGGLSLAARRLAMPKSTVARRIRELEDQLGASLTHKSARRLSLTTFGRECYDRCRRLATEADDLFAFAESVRAQPSGRLHVICPAFLGELVIERLATEFAEATPRVHLHLDTASSVFDPRAVEADLIIYPTFEAALPDSDVTARKLVSSAYVLACAPQLLEDAPPLTDPDMLVERPCLGFGTKRSEWSWTLTRGSERCVTRFTPRFSTSSLSALLRATRAGLGIASLPLVVCGEDLRAGRLVHVLQAWRPPPVTIFALHPGRRNLTAAARVWLDFIIRHVDAFEGVSAPVTDR